MCVWDSSEVGRWRSGGGPDLATLGLSLESGEIARRVDRRRSFAQFEVKLRRIDVAGVAGLGDHLPALDLFAPLHVEFAIVAVSRDEAVRMLDEDEVAVSFKSVARVDDGAALGRPNRRAGRDRDVDAVVAACLEPLNDAAARGPAELRLRAGGVGLRAGQRRLRRRGARIRGCPSASCRSPAFSPPRTWTARPRRPLRPWTLWRPLTRTSPPPWRPCRLWRSSLSLCPSPSWPTWRRQRLRRRYRVSFRPFPSQCWRPRAHRRDRRAPRGAFRSSPQRRSKTRWRREAQRSARRNGPRSCPASRHCRRRSASRRRRSNPRPIHQPPAASRAKQRAFQTRPARFARVATIVTPGVGAA